MASAQSSRSEKVLASLTRAPDGAALELVKLCGVGVPADADLYLCKRTFVGLQIRTKVAAQSGGLVHDYDVDPDAINAGGKGGVFELQCVRSKHQLQVKVQPPLGLEDLLPPYSESPDTPGLSRLLEKDIWPCLGVFYILFAFVSDPDKKSLPLAPGYPDSPKMIDWILEDQKMLDGLCSKVPVFSRSYVQPPTLTLLEPARPKTRGMLLKAFLEVKLLLIRAVTQIRFNGPDLLNENQYTVFEDFMVHMYQDCCAGGVEAQYLGLEETRDGLRYLVCGGEPPKPPPAEETKGGASSSGDGERQRYQSLLSALGDVSRQLESSAVGLTELSSLIEAGAPPLPFLSAHGGNGNGAASEVAEVAELWAQVKQQIEELGIRACDLQGACESAAKRARTQ